ncbi:PQQ-dependent sugar dehydrogenase [Mucilaginibacter phyllosphaerae]|uniref:Glucose/arabinose dehydrogenase n=1 Tax=Mucilaginibacter phyllosphaerae TaxID=1812349 RepID=A0A4Y8AEB8_9SPHI|nr:PQQ-dependent sugar dehydrogenase [Mucilaginibacter phyllosphaerae]MBB3970034.1 glucose/arabinose dehydrogenase [Mucilaginibacter phyllosphaerae]TEW66429.1 PQQ-dependent sugar dehydrogenase [Mucilaginibacter phyllosphaerae]GGH09295.1 glucose dehydrogenase [Mucilaginibacter phyllosphaerae]
MITYNKHLLIALGLFSAINGHAKAVNAKRDTTLAPVETQSANTNYKPAFRGQTRIGGIKTKTPYTATVINSELKNPWGIHVLPDGRFLITEKGATMRILKANGSFDKQIAGLPAVLARGQGGLLDVTIDPAFAKNRMIYWGYSEPPADGSLLAIAKARLSADDSKLENVEVIYRANPPYKGTLQYGCRIVFDKQGNLFVSTGERSGVDIRMKAQDLSAGIGKIIHITKAGKAVAGGPFAGKPNALPEIYAYGLRNPDGLAWNPVTGELWEAEFGPRGGDEINIIRQGKNYGWPVVTYGIEYSGEKVGEGIQQKEGVTQPVYYWDPTISPGNITFYTGNITEWKNNLFVAGLSGQHIARLVIKANKVTGEERLLKDKNERWRAVVTGKDGALYGMTDSGKLYRIAKK